MAEKDGVIPSGSMSVHDVPDDKSGQDNASDKNDKKGGGDKETPFLGSWKSKEDAEKGLKNLQDKLTSQGDELGGLRKQTQTLTETMKSIQDGQGGKGKDKGGDKGATKPDINGKLAEVLDEYGQVDFYGDEKAGQKGGELMKQAISLTAQMVKEDTLKETDSTVRNILKEKDMDMVRSKFLDENPDFTELQGNGAFQAFKSKNPLHDDFSAYHAYRADLTMQENEALTAKMEELQKVANLAGGDAGTSKVFTKPGGGMRESGKQKPKNLSELKASALEAVRNAKGG